MSKWSCFSLPAWSPSSGLAEVSQQQLLSFIPLPGFPSDLGFSTDKCSSWALCRTFYWAKYWGQLLGTGSPGLLRSGVTSPWFSTGLTKYIALAKVLRLLLPNKCPSSHVTRTWAGVWCQHYRAPSLPSPQIGTGLQTPLLSSEELEELLAACVLLLPWAADSVYRGHKSLLPPASSPSL